MEWFNRQKSILQGHKYTNSTNIILVYNFLPFLETNIQLYFEFEIVDYEILRLVAFKRVLDSTKGIYAT